MGRAIRGRAKRNSVTTPYWTCILGRIPILVFVGSFLTLILSSTVWLACTSFLLIILFLCKGFFSTNSFLRILCFIVTLLCNLIAQGNYFLLNEFQIKIPL